MITMSKKYKKDLPIEGPKELKKFDDRHSDPMNIKSLDFASLLKFDGRQANAIIGPETNYEPMFRLTDLLYLAKYHPESRYNWMKRVYSIDKNSYPTRFQNCFESLQSKINLDGLQALLNKEETLIAISYMNTESAERMRAIFLLSYDRTVQHLEEMVKQLKLGETFNNSRLLRADRDLRLNGNIDHSSAWHSNMDARDSVKHIYFKELGLSNISFTTLVNKINFAIFNKHKVSREDVDASLLQVEEEIYNTLLRDLEKMVDKLKDNRSPSLSLDEIVEYALEDIPKLKRKYGRQNG